MQIPKEELKLVEGVLVEVRPKPSALRVPFLRQLIVKVLRGKGDLLVFCLEQGWLISECAPN